LKFCFQNGKESLTHTINQIFRIEMTIELVVTLLNWLSTVATAKSVVTSLRKSCQLLDQDTISAKTVNGFKSKLELERKRKMGLFLDWSLLGLMAVFNFLERPDL